MTKSTNKRHRFSDAEKEAIVRGVRVYGVGAFLHDNDMYMCRGTQLNLCWFLKHRNRAFDDMPALS